MLQISENECDLDETSHSALFRTVICSARILPLDTMQSQTRFQAITTDNKRFEIDNTARCLLEYLREPRSLTDLLATAERNRWQFSGAPITLPIVEEQLIRRGLVNLCGAEKAIEDEAAPKKAGAGSGYEFLTLHRDLLTRSVLRPVTKALAVLLNPIGIQLGILFTLVTHVTFLAYLWRGANHMTTSVQDWWMILGLVYASVLWHELGHASACERFGAKHGPIGIGVYLIYPVMYCNVTDAWKLPRMQRAIVDGAGIYFHCLFASIFCILALRFPSPVSLWVVISIWSTILFNLNPFFKFDGYWILTDLLGISSLHRISAALWRRVILFDKDPQTHRELREMPNSIRYTVFGYSVLYAAAMAFFAERIMRMLIPYCVKSLIHDLPLMILQIEARHIDAILCKQVFQLAFLLLCTYSGLSFLTNGVLAIIRALRNA
ncbi:MAG: hypothetical protein ABSF70_10585 [Terracidiphilus sp.]